jgi:hypothetical protein
MLSKAPPAQPLTPPTTKTPPPPPPQVCDRIAETGGLWVVMPELLSADEAWPMARYPPESVWKNRFADWIRIGHGAWESNQEKVAAVAAAVVAESAAAVSRWPEAPEPMPEGAGGGVRYGIAGVGWGGYLAACAGAEGALSPAAPQPTAVASLSPQFHGRDAKLAAALSSPLIILPSKYDSMDQLQVHVSTRKDVYARCFFKRYGRCYPGLLSYKAVFADYDPDLADRLRRERPKNKKVQKGKRKQLDPLFQAQAAMREVADVTDMVDLAAGWLKGWLAGRPPAEQVRGDIQQDKVKGREAGSEGDEEDYEEGEEDGSDESDGDQYLADVDGEEEGRRKE